MDILHRGHLLMLKNSKSVAGENGRLIVGIVSDEAVVIKKGIAPILSFPERLELAQSIKYVDLVVEQKEYLPFENIKSIRPTILMESDSHDTKAIKEAQRVMEKIGGKVIVMPYFQGQSSTQIKKKISSTSK
jgi:glycerol-3-phosphate cytidylyltransferase